ncbi:MAG: ROK family protein [Deltaproteobacteria bacterium]|jgi:glucokinase|nr:ROK family protein [Deltaproteobacteria bacterium]
MPFDEETFLALDIGGTNVKSGLISRRGEILSFGSFPTAEGGGPDSLIALIVDRLKGLWNEAGRGRRPKALAIGAPGWIRRREGVVVMAPNLPGWKDLPITRIMSQALDIPAVLENDANLYALGEWLSGAGKGSLNEITLTLGTGVGGGLILQGRLWGGSFTSAAEVGHIPLGGVDRVCGCGRTGCLETVASALGMASLAREWIASGRETLYPGDPGEVNTEVMQDLAARGDPMSLSIFARAGEAIGFVLAGIFNLLSLETAVIGGGGAGAFEFMSPGILEVLSRHLVTATMEQIKVVKGALGGNAPLIGSAALLAEAGF